MGRQTLLSALKRVFNWNRKQVVYAEKRAIFAQLSPQYVVPKLYQCNIFNEHYRLNSFKIDTFSKNCRYIKIGEEHQQWRKKLKSFSKFIFPTFCLLAEQIGCATEIFVNAVHSFAVYSFQHLRGLKVIYNFANFSFKRFISFQFSCIATHDP